MQRRALVPAALLCLLALTLIGARDRDQTANTNITFCAGKKTCAGKNSRIKSIRVTEQAGARPSFSPDGKEIVFDRVNSDDGFADVYVADLNGKILHSVTDNNPHIAQRNNGNAVFAPSGKYLVFESEAPQHLAMQAKYLGDPGNAWFCNLWATTPTGSQFWQLTNIPIKQTLVDGLPFYASLNPHFSKDGSKLVWSERYAEGGHFHWGKWHVKMADFTVTPNGPTLTNVTTVFTPTQGNYVTAMGFINPTTLLLAGNLNGQHEFGMDQYTYNMTTHKLVNLQNSPKIWEEDASITPHGHIVYMTNYDQKDKLDFNNPDWTHQPRERDYWMMDFNGKNKTRLTYFNDSKAPEFIKHRVVVASSAISPDGKYLVGTVGIDFGTQTRSQINLKVVIIQFQPPI